MYKQFPSCPASLLIFEMPVVSVERRQSKTEWKAFTEALAGSGGHVQLKYNSLTKLAKSSFRDQWRNDPDWDFVSQFKERRREHKQVTGAKKCFKTAFQLKRDLGKKGAARHMNLMKTKAGGSRTDEAGNTFYLFSEDYEVEEVGKTDSKQISSQATVKPKGAGAIKDKGADDDVPKGVKEPKP